MRKLRVTASMRKSLSDARGANGSARRGGVMVIPRMKSVEEWEALALASQEKLIADARDSAGVIERPPSLEDVSHRYKVTR